MPARTRRTSLAGQRSGSVEQFTTDADQDVRNTKHMEALPRIDKPVAETVPGRGAAASREECHGQPAVLSISSSRRRLLRVSERRRRTAASKQRPILPLAAVRTQVTSWWIRFGHVPAGARGKAHVRALRDHGEEERGSGSTHGLMSAVAVPVCPSIACGAVEC